MYLLVTVLLIVIVIFGVSSGMQSYATAQQAQATIEVAQVAQVNAWGNLVTILTLTLVILAALALIVFALYWFFLRMKIQKNVRTSVKQFQPESDHTPVFGPSQMIGQLVQLETLRMLKSLNASSTNTQANKQLSVPREEDPVDDYGFPWLR